MLTDQQRQDAAAALAGARESGSPIAPLRETWPDIDVVDAYEIQLIGVGEQMAAGRQVKGHKVGLSAKAMQQMLGVDEPDYGHLLDDMVLFENDTVAAGSLLQPRIEVEVAFVLGASLRGPGCTVADVLAATDYVTASLEIIDSRVADWNIRLVDTIADNASAGAVVLGGQATPVGGLDLRTIGAVLWRNGEIVATGASGAVLGNPATAVAWLANKVADFGVTLEEGHIILPGSCTKAIDVAPGDTFRAEFDQLGPVTVNFA